MGRKHKRSCGVDVHESNLTVAIIDINDNIVAEGIFQNDVKGHMEFVKWLKKHKTRSVGMESTGVYWKAIALGLISCGIDVEVGNAYEMKNVPGRKTDKLDARWIARLLRDGYIPKSNILSKESDDFRSIIRVRLRLVRERTATKNRISALIAKSGIRIKTSDKFGCFGQKVLKAIAEGESLEDIFKSPQALKLEYSMDEFISLLEKHLSQPTRMQLQIWLDMLEHLDQQIDEIEDVILTMIHNDETKLRQIEIIRSVPGFKDIASPIVLAEVGDIFCFPSSSKFSSYCGLVSSVYQSGEREVDGKTVEKVFMGRLKKMANKRLKWIFILAANVVAKLPNSDLVKPLKDFYRRILRRNHGRYARQKAIVALAHKLTKIVWTLLTKGEVYQGVGCTVKNVRPLKNPLSELAIHEKNILDRVCNVFTNNEEKSIMDRIDKILIHSRRPTNQEIIKNVSMV